MGPPILTATHVILEKYEYAIHKQSGTLSPPLKSKFKWLHLNNHKKEEQHNDKKEEHKEEHKEDHKETHKKDDKRQSRFFTIKHKKNVPSNGDSNDESEDHSKTSKDGYKTLSRRLSQHHLQKQIQLLRDMHQFNTEKIGVKENSRAKLSTPWDSFVISPGNGTSGPREGEVSNSSPLSKSISMPVISPCS